MFFSSRACQIIAGPGSGHFVRYCEINPDRDQGHQNAPRTILQTDVLTGKWKTFTFRKHFVFQLQDSFHLEIYIFDQIFQKKYHSTITARDLREGVNCTNQSAGLGYSFKMVIDDLNSFSGVTKINLYHNRVCKTTPDCGSIHFMSVYKFCCHA